MQAITKMIAYSLFINRISGQWAYISAILQRQFSIDVSCEKITVLIRKDLKVRALYSDSCFQLSQILNPANY